MSVNLPRKGDLILFHGIEGQRVDYDAGPYKMMDITLSGRVTLVPDGMDYGSALQVQLSDFLVMMEAGVFSPAEQA